MKFDEIKVCDNPDILQYNGFELKIGKNGLYTLTISFDSIKKQKINDLELGNIEISNSIINWETIKIGNDIFVRCQEKKGSEIIDIAYKLCIKDYREPTMYSNGKKIGYTKDYFMKQVLAYKKEEDRMFKKRIVIDPKNNNIWREIDEEIDENDKKYIKRIFSKNIFKKTIEGLFNTLK